MAKFNDVAIQLRPNDNVAVLKHPTKPQKHSAQDIAERPAAGRRQSRRIPGRAVTIVTRQVTMATVVYRARFPGEDCGRS